MAPQLLQFAVVDAEMAVVAYEQLVVENAQLAVVVAEAELAAVVAWAKNMATCAFAGASKHRHSWKFLRWQERFP